MPQFEKGKDFYIHNSTFTDVGHDCITYHGARQTGELFLFPWVSGLTDLPNLEALSILESQVAAGAFHNSSKCFDLPKCHPRTHIAVLDKIRTWYKDEHPASPHIMWLYGPAGAGKSAITQTMAEECYEFHTLAASFFFSRIAPNHNDATRLIATIAYQIAHDIPNNSSFNRCSRMTQWSSQSPWKPSFISYWPNHYSTYDLTSYGRKQAGVAIYALMMTSLFLVRTATMLLFLALSMFMMVSRVVLAFHSF